MKQQKRLTMWGKEHSPVAYKWAQLTAGKNVPNSQCVRPIVSETAKNVNGSSQSWWKHMKSQKREWKNAPAAPKTWRRQPNPQHYQNDLPSMGKMKPQQKTWKEKHRKLQLLPKREENWKTWMPSRMAYVFGHFSCQGSQNTFFKNGSLPNSNFLPILFPFHAITNSTTFWQK